MLTGTRSLLVLFGAGGNIEAPQWGLRLVASAHNLANTPVVDFTGYPLPGRSVFLTLQWSTPDANKETWNEPPPL